MIAGILCLILGVALSALALGAVIGVLPLQEYTLLTFLLAQVLLSVAIMRLSKDTARVQVRAFSFLFIISVITLLVGFLQGSEVLMVVSEFLLVLAFVVVFSGRPVEMMISEFENAANYLGAAAKNVAKSLFIYWVLVKVNLLGSLLSVFETPDRILILVFVLYACGVVLSEFGSSIVHSDLAHAVSSSIFTGFLTLLGLLIASFILTFLGAVGAEWFAFHALLWKVTIAALLLAVASFFALGSPFAVSEAPIEKVEVSPELYVVEKTSTLLLSESLEALVRSGSLATELRGRSGLAGYFLSGEISYTVELDGIRLNGDANSVCLISSDERLLSSVRKELHLRQYGARKFLVEEIKKRARDMLNVLRRFFGRHLREIVRLPFIKVVSSDSYEYVKVGPILVIDTPDWSYVSLGGIRVCEKKRRTEVRRRETVVAFEDVARGCVVVSISGKSLVLQMRDIYIRQSGRELLVRRGQMTYRRFRGKSILKYKSIEIVTEANYAALHFDKSELKVNGEVVELVRNGSVRVLEDWELSQRILSTVKHYMSEMPKSMLRGSHHETLARLLEEVEGILASL